MSKLVIITGSPGTGKERLARLLAKRFAFDRLDLHQHYGTISVDYNHRKQCYDLDLKKLEKLVLQGKKKSVKGLIFDSHISHLLPKKMVDLCIVLTRSDLKKMRRRLKARKYSAKKIRENLDAEIFQVCLNEAKENDHKLQEFDADKKPYAEILNELIPKLRNLRQTS